YIVILIPSDIELIKSYTSDRINQTADPDITYRLLGIIESAITEIADLKKEVQSLRDEVNRLKGEKGKPDIRKNRGSPDDYSSEEERSRVEKPAPKGRIARNHKIHITREKVCHVPIEILPEDAVFKGYSTVIVQDLQILPDNIRFLIERYYSPSTGKTYSGSRPEGYEGEFGPGIKSLIIGMKYCCNVSEPGIEDFLTYHGVYISGSTISRYLTQNLEYFHNEKDELTHSGLQSTTFQQMDDTGARVNGRQYYTHILCNHYYTSFHTLPHKDRLSLLQLVLGPHPLHFLFNEDAFRLLGILKLPIAVISHFQQNCAELTLDEESLNVYLAGLPTRNKSVATLHRKIKEAAAIAWYHNQTFWPIIETLLTDDAPQFDLIAFNHALCWVHAGRSLKKLNPLNPAFQEILSNKLNEFWDYYHLLADFKEFPLQEKILSLQDQFDAIFNVNTGYPALDDKLKSIKNNKDKLLQVLNNPEIPLHNNASELGARVQVRKRDVSLHTITPEGTRAVDTFLSLKETTRKLGVNFFEYLLDRITKAGKIERLSHIIQQKAGLIINNECHKCTS
ncbi:MAG: transposase, partial [Candidatus Taylorbacteria bacterium]